MNVSFWYGAPSLNANVTRIFDVTLTLTESATSGGVTLPVGEKFDLNSENKTVGLTTNTRLPGTPNQYYFYIFPK